MPTSPETGLSSLLIPEPSRHEIDVVFVHGLNGHRSASWTNQASELWPLWLRDDLQTTRAWTYGYDASIWVGSRDSIKLHSLRFLECLVDKRVGRCVGRAFFCTLRYLLVLIAATVQVGARGGLCSDHLHCAQSRRHSHKICGCGLYKSFLSNRN